MNPKLTVCCLAMLTISCKLFTNSDKQLDDPEKTTYHIRLAPPPNASYHYDINNLTEVEVETQQGKVNTSNESTVGQLMAIGKDTSGDVHFRIAYDKVHLVLKNGGVVTEADADNAAFAATPLDRMVGALKKASITATITPQGQVKKIDGYDGLSRELMAGLDTTQPGVREAAQKQLDKIIGAGMIQKNLDQLFRIFPDSSVRLGDKWKLDSKDNGELSMDVHTVYWLKDISDGVVLVASESTLANVQAPVTSMGVTTSSDLKGTQQAEYQIEARTGMLISSNASGELSGNMQAGGQSFPIKIKTHVRIDGHRTK